MFQEQLIEAVDNLNILAAKKGKLMTQPIEATFLSATCYNEDNSENAKVTINGYYQNPDQLVTLFKTAMDSDPKFAYLMGQTIARLNQNSYDTFSKGVFDAEQTFRKGNTHD